ncbi:MAG: hypothetical protein QOE83_2125 [Actinomycetota bacterium]|jgi:hypothetical protein|nr:hypothetical protein [Actinomycetota bacterium]
MEKKFRFLEQLEDDLRDAAARERVARESKGPKPETSSSRGDGRWTRWVAAAVVVLVVAGGVGALVQNPDKYSATGTGGARVRASIVPAPRALVPQKAADRSRFSYNQSDTVTHGATGGVEAAAGALVPDSFQGFNDVGISKSVGSQPPALQDLSKVVRTGAITVQLPAGKFSAARDLVTSYAAKANGYVMSSSARGGVSGTFVLRIPARKLDAVMQLVQDLPGGEVLLQNSSSQDVTAEFVDSGAELEILKSEKAATLRYLKNAGSLGQAIQFRNQAFQIQGDIDKLQGRLNYLSNQVSLATLTVNLREVGAPTSVRDQTPVTKPSLVRAWDRAIGGFLGVVSAVIVGLGFLIPLAILVVAIGFPVMALRRRRRVASSTP